MLGALVHGAVHEIPNQFGSWNIHGGVNFLGFGETTKLVNKGDAGQVSCKWRHRHELLTFLLEGAVKLHSSTVCFN